MSPSLPSILLLPAPLEPFDLSRFFTDEGASVRQLAPETYGFGKHPTQQRERTQLPVRLRLKRLARNTNCFSASIELPDIVLGLCAPRSEDGLLS